MVLHPTYFIDVVSLYHLVNSGSTCIEVHGGYIKQTYRNRCYVAAANGRMSLTIPIVHDRKDGRYRYDEVRIDHQQPWASNHLKTIASAYRSSPYYEFYEDSLKELFSQIPPGLMDWNICTLGWILKEMGFEQKITRTKEFANDKVAEHLAKAKGTTRMMLPPYIQVFQEKHGFLYPLSGLDLLFNLGPASLAYLIQARGYGQ